MDWRRGQRLHFVAAAAAALVDLFWLVVFTLSCTSTSTRARFEKKGMVSNSGRTNEYIIWKKYAAVRILITNTYIVRREN